MVAVAQEPHTRIIAREIRFADQPAVAHHPVMDKPAILVIA